MLKRNLAACLHLVVISYTRDDQRRYNHEDPSGNDRSEIEHRPQLPSAMLLDLQPFDIIIRHCDGHSSQDHKCTNSRLNIKSSAESSAGDYECSHIGNEDE